MGLDTLIGMAVLPGFLLMMYFYKKDIHEPEPVDKVRKVLLWGAAVSALAIAVELPLNYVVNETFAEGSMSHAFFMAFLVAATVEELCKYLVVRKTIYDDPEFDEPYDGIVYCVAASLGFAIAENILYVLGGGIGVAILRALLSVPAHALFGVFLGYFMGLSKFVEPPKRLRYHLVGLAIAIFTHGLYDFVLFTGKPMVQLTVFPMMGVFWMLGLWKVKKLVAASPFIGMTPEERGDIIAKPAAAVVGVAGSVADISLTSEENAEPGPAIAEGPEKKPATGLFIPRDSS
jgi:protease PrsW